MQRSGTLGQAHTSVSGAKHIRGNLHVYSPQGLLDWITRGLYNVTGVPCKIYLRTPYIHLVGSVSSQSLERVLLCESKKDALGAFARGALVTSFSQNVVGIERRTVVVTHC